MYKIYSTDQFLANSISLRIGTVYTHYFSARTVAQYTARLLIQRTLLPCATVTLDRESGRTYVVVVGEIPR